MNLRDFSFLVILGLFISAPSRAEVVDRLEAIVNKSPIFKSDMERFKITAPLRAKVDPLFANEPLSKKVKPTDSEILDFLIDESIILGKFPVSDGEVEQEINAIQSNLKIDRENLKAAILREGFKFEDYFRMMRVSVAKRQLVDREIRNKAAVSDDDVRAEFNRSRSGSKAFRGSFRLQLIRISKSNYKSVATAKEEATRALDSLKRGAAFADVAKSVSDDPSQESGGDLGFLSYSEMSPLLQKEVQRLGPEKTSNILEDKNSFLIVKIGEIRADGDAAYEKEKDVIRSRLMESEFQHQVRIWLDRERSLNFVKVNQKSK
ncbi:MAG: peptidylprolyl isomerase [Bdellovibrionales bacterium]|nr:peptidylprolyl isomerase [Bdellovibrionales bacterium]